MAFLVELIVSFLLVAGGLFALVGSYGLIKLPDLLTRLHAPTKATTLGVGSLLVASMIHFAFAGAITVHELLITAFLMLTAPVTAHFIAKAFLHRHRDKSGALPAPEDGSRDWATFAPPPDSAAPPRPGNPADNSAPAPR